MTKEERSQRAKDRARKLKHEALLRPHCAVAMGKDTYLVLESGTDWLTVRVKQEDLCGVLITTDLYRLARLISALTRRYNEAVAELNRSLVQSSIIDLAPEPPEIAPEAKPE